MTSYSSNKSSVKKWFLRSVLIFLGVIILLVATTFIIIVTQEKRIINLALSEFNETIRGKVTIGEPDVSLIKHFPNISIVLTDVRLYKEKTDSKPITQIGTLYAGLNLNDLIAGNYEVKKLAIHEGLLLLVREESGHLNLQEAFKPIHADTTSKGTSQQIKFSLDDAELRQLKVFFFDDVTDNRVKAAIENITASFELEDERVTTSLNGNMELDFFSPSDTSFFRHKKIEMTTKISYNTATSSLSISSGSVKLQGGSFTVMGTANFSDQPDLMFKVIGEKPDINLIAAFLPGDVKEKLKPFKYDGRIYFDATITGKLAQDELPLLEVSFGFENAWFLNTQAGRKLDEFGFEGYYTNGSEHSLRTSELHLMNLSARPEKGIFKGNFVMRDFSNPQTLIQVKSELELKFVGEFLGIPDLKQTTGRIKLDMDFKDLNGIELPEQSLNKLKEGTQSKLVVEDLSFKIPGYPHAIDHLNARAEMKNGKVTLDSSSFKIGDSDFKLNGMISDIQSFIKNRQNPITIELNASSKKILIGQLLDYDTALANKFKDEVTNFNIGLKFQTSVAQVLHPDPLPIGQAEMKNLRATFKEYPHTFRDVGATLIVNDTSIVMRNLNGMIDNSDFAFSGRVINYHLWFSQFKTGKTRIGFDFKSNRFAMTDVLGPVSRKYIPRGYRKEEASKVWLRARVEMRYDTVFKFAKAEIFNVSGDLLKHHLKLKDIKGKIKYGTNRVLILDTLTGKIGESDFDINLRLFAGKDKNSKKRINSLRFHSSFLDGDEISSYDLAPAKQRTKKPDSTQAKVVMLQDTATHAKAFNIFAIPFSDFNVDVNIDKLKYNKLWLKDVTSHVRMQEDHQIFIDTLSMDVAGGTLAMNGQLNGADTSKIFFKSFIKAERIDLEKMMLKLDHFGHDVVINKNIKGILSGDIKSYVQVHPNFVPIVSKAKAELDIEIYNGSLVDFAPMQAISSYFKDKNLRMVRFDTLKNNLSFSEGTLNIPVMDINSSIGFIQLSGKQSVDLTMEYYVRVPMRIVTKAGFSALFEGKGNTVDAGQVDQIESAEKYKNANFMNLKVAGKPEKFKVSLGKDKADGGR